MSESDHDYPDSWVSSMSCKLRKRVYIDKTLANEMKHLHYLNNTCAAITFINSLSFQIIPQNEPSYRIIEIKKSSYVYFSLLIQHHLSSRVSLKQSHKTSTSCVHLLVSSQKYPYCREVIPLQKIKLNNMNCNMNMNFDFEPWETNLRPKW